jgi:hypothetical protein
MRLTFFTIGFAVSVLWACNGKHDINDLNPNMDNFLKSDIHLDNDFERWYMESRFDSIIANKSRVNTRLQHGIVALAYIELDSIKQAEKLLFPFIKDDKMQDRIPQKFHFYEQMACYRIAELRESNPKELNKIMSSFSINALTADESYFYPFQVEGKFLDEVVDSLRGEFEFKYASNELLKQYPNYLRGKFLSGAYNYYYKHYDIAVPMLTELFYRHYRRSYTGGLLYDYYSQQNLIHDSANVYQPYKREFENNKIKGQ